VYDHLLAFLTTASQRRHRVTFSIVASSAVCGQRARLGGKLLPMRRDNPLALRLRAALPRFSINVRQSTVRLPRRSPLLCTLDLGDWFLSSNSVTTSVMPPREPINTQEPSVCKQISELTLRFALVWVATGWPTQACDTNFGFAWGQRGSSRPETQLEHKELCVGKETEWETSAMSSGRPFRS
jgi:hypothetical protein